MICFNISDSAVKARSRFRLVPVFLLGFSTLFFTINSSAAELVINGSFESPDLMTLPVDSRAFKKGWTTFYGQNYRPEICTDNAWEVECNDDVLLPGWSMWWTDTILMRDPTTGNLVANPAPDEVARLEVQNNALADRVNPKFAAANIVIEAFNATLPAGDPAIKPLKPMISYAKHGTQKAELDTHDRIDELTGEELINHNVSLAQTLLTCVGHPYTLTYNWRSRTVTPGDNDVRVVVADNIVRTHLLTADWVKETVNFVATDPTTFLAFISIGDGTTKGMSLDNVSVIGPTPNEFGECPTECPTCTEDLTADTNSDGVHDLLDHDGGAISCNCTPTLSKSGKGGSGGGGDGSECGLCAVKGGFASLSILYDGDDFSNHGQGADKSSVIPEVVPGGLPLEATIKVIDEKTDDVLLSGSYFVGQVFDIKPLVLGDKLSNEIRIEIYDGSDLLQAVRFHTSCSQPLDTMDSFGGITIWDGEKL